MSDVWAESLYQASYGGVQFDCLTTSDSIRRAIARHLYPRKDGGDLRDMGADPRETTCQIIFFERPPIEGEDADSRLNHLQRFAKFKAAVDRGKAQSFTHPLTGTYQAVVENIQIDTDPEERNVVLVTCTFVEDTTQPAVFQPGSSRPIGGGVAAVQVAADQVNASLADAGLSSTVADDAASTVDSWDSDPDIAVRAVNLQLATLSSQIDDAMDFFDLATNPDRFVLYRDLQRLHYQLNLAAETYRQTQPQLMQITLLTTKPLLLVATETYGAAEAQSRYAQLQKLNDIDDPTSIPAGTVLQAEVPGQGRAG